MPHLCSNRLQHVPCIVHRSYGRVEVQCKLQLSPVIPRGEQAPAQLNGLPLSISMAAMLRPPRHVPSPSEFFRAWAGLPARAEFSGEQPPGCRLQAGLDEVRPLCLLSAS